MKYLKKILLLLSMGIMVMSCDKFQKIQPPTEVTSSDMLALFMNDQVDIDRVVAYSKVWRITLTNLVDEKIAKNDDLANDDLKAEKENVEKVVKKLQALTTYAKDDARIELNATVLNINQILEKLQRHLDARVKKTENTTQNNPTPVATPTPSAPKTSVTFEGPERWASPANTQHGFINLRQFPNAKSKSLRYLYQWPDRDVFLVRKVAGSKFYGVFEGGSLVGYVNGDYICFE